MPALKTVFRLCVFLIELPKNPNFEKFRIQRHLSATPSRTRRIIHTQVLLRRRDSSYVPTSLAPKKHHPSARTTAAQKTCGVNALRGVHLNPLSIETPFLARYAQPCLVIRLRPLPLREGNSGRLFGVVRYCLSMPTYQVLDRSHAVCIHRHGS